MTRLHPPRRTWCAVLLTLALGCTLHTEDDEQAGEGDAGEDPARVEATCRAYCDRAAECDDDIDADACVADCDEVIAACMDDEQLQTMDDLEGCAASECGEFDECTVGAGLQCTFGL
jgi:hypothetical protein